MSPYNVLGGLFLFINSMVHIWLLPWTPYFRPVEDGQDMVLKRYEGLV